MSKCKRPMDSQASARSDRNLRLETPAKDRRNATGIHLSIRAGGATAIRCMAHMIKGEGISSHSWRRRRLFRPDASRHLQAGSVQPGRSSYNRACRRRDRPLRSKLRRSPRWKGIGSATPRYWQVDIRGTTDIPQSSGLSAWNRKIHGIDRTCPLSSPIRSHSSRSSRPEPSWGGKHWRPYSHECQ